MPAKRQLGEILTEDYHVLEKDLREALQAQSLGHERLGQYLVRKGILSDRDLATALGQQLGVPVVIGLPRLHVSDEVLAFVPMRCAEKKLVIPVALDGNASGRRLILAMADPTDTSVIDALEGLTGFRIQPAIATEEEIRRAFKVFYLGERGHADPLELSGSFEMMRRRLRGEPTPKNLRAQAVADWDAIHEIDLPEPESLDPIPLPEPTEPTEASGAIPFDPDFAGSTAAS